MPSLARHIRQVGEERFDRSYDEVELARLQLVYDRACETVGLDERDPRRDSIGKLIFQMADHVADPAELLSTVVKVFGRAN